MNSASSPWLASAIAHAVTERVPDRQKASVLELADQRSAHGLGRRLANKRSVNIGEAGLLGGGFHLGGTRLVGGLAIGPIVDDVPVASRRQRGHVFQRNLRRHGKPVGYNAYLGHFCYLAPRNRDKFARLRKRSRFVLIRSPM